MAAAASPSASSYTRPPLASPQKNLAAAAGSPHLHQPPSHHHASSSSSSSHYARAHAPGRRRLCSPPASLSPRVDAHSGCSLVYEPLPPGARVDWQRFSPAPRQSSKQDHQQHDNGAGAAPNKGNDGDGDKDDDDDGAHSALLAARLHLVRLRRDEVASSTASDPTKESSGGGKGKARRIDPEGDDALPPLVRKLMSGTLIHLETRRQRRVVGTAHATDGSDDRGGGGGRGQARASKRKWGGGARTWQRRRAVALWRFTCTWDDAEEATSDRTSSSQAEARARTGAVGATGASGGGSRLGDASTAVPTVASSTEDDDAALPSAGFGRLRRETGSYALASLWPDLDACEPGGSAGRAHGVASSLRPAGEGARAHRWFLRALRERCLEEWLGGARALPRATAWAAEAGGAEEPHGQGDDEEDAEEGQVDGRPEPRGTSTRRRPRGGGSGGHQVRLGSSVVFLPATSASPLAAGDEVDGNGGTDCLDDGFGVHTPAQGLAAVELRAFTTRNSLAVHARPRRMAIEPVMIQRRATTAILPPPGTPLVLAPTGTQAILLGTTQLRSEDAVDSWGRISDALYSVGPWPRDDDGGGQGAAPWLIVALRHMPPPSPAPPPPPIHADAADARRAAAPGQRSAAAAADGPRALVWPSHLAFVDLTHVGGVGWPGHAEAALAQSAATRHGEAMWPRQLFGLSDPRPRPHQPPDSFGLFAKPTAAVGRQAAELMRQVLRGGEGDAAVDGGEAAEDDGSEQEDAAQSGAEAASSLASSFEQSSSTSASPVEGDAQAEVVAPPTATVEEDSGTDGVPKQISPGSAAEARNPTHVDLPAAQPHAGPASLDADDRGTEPATDLARPDAMDGDLWGDLGLDADAGATRGGATEEPASGRGARGDGDDFMMYDGLVTDADFSFFDDDVVVESVGDVGQAMAARRGTADFSMLEGVELPAPRRDEAASPAQGFGGGGGTESTPGGGGGGGGVHSQTTGPPSMAMVDPPSLPGLTDGASAASPAVTGLASKATPRTPWSPPMHDVSIVLPGGSNGQDIVYSSAAAVGAVVGEQSTMRHDEGTTARTTPSLEGQRLHSGDSPHPSPGPAAYAQRLRELSSKYDMGKFAMPSNPLKAGSGDGPARAGAESAAQPPVRAARSRLLDRVSRMDTDEDAASETEAGARLSPAAASDQEGVDDDDDEGDGYDEEDSDADDGGGGGGMDGDSARVRGRVDGPVHTGRVALDAWPHAELLQSALAFATDSGLWEARMYPDEADTNTDAGADDQGKVARMRLTTRRRSAESDSHHVGPAGASGDAAAAAVVSAAAAAKAQQEMDTIAAWLAGNPNLRKLVVSADGDGLAEWAGAERLYARGLICCPCDGRRVVAGMHGLAERSVSLEGIGPALLTSPPLLMGCQGAVAEVGASAVRFWDKLSLCAASGPRSVTAFVLHDGEADDAVVGEIGSWLDRMGRLFASLGLGSHRPAPDCLLGIGAEGGAAGLARKLREIAQDDETWDDTMQSIVWRVRPYLGLHRHVVVYLAGEPVWPLLLRTYVRLEEDLRRYARSKLGLAGDHIVVRPLPLSLTTESSLAWASRERPHFDPRQLALSVFESCDLSPRGGGGGSWVQMPAITLPPYRDDDRGGDADDVEARGIFRLQHPGPPGDLLDRGTLLFIGYDIVAGDAERARVLVTATDERGQGHASRMWPRRRAETRDDVRADVASVWRFARDFAARTSIAWRVVVCRLGRPLPGEIEAWEALHHAGPIAHVKPMLDVALICVDDAAPLVVTEAPTYIAAEDDALTAVEVGAETPKNDSCPQHASPALSTFAPRLKQPPAPHSLAQSPLFQQQQHQQGSAPSQQQQQPPPVQHHELIDVSTMWFAIHLRERMWVDVAASTGGECGGDSSLPLLSLRTSAMLCVPRDSDLGAAEPAGAVAARSSSEDTRAVRTLWLHLLLVLPCCGGGRDGGTGTGERLPHPLVTPVPTPPPKATTSAATAKATTTTQAQPGADGGDSATRAGGGGTTAPPTLDERLRRVTRSLYALGVLGRERFGLAPEGALPWPLAMLRVLRQGLRHVDESV